MRFYIISVKVWHLGRRQTVSGEKKTVSVIVFINAFQLFGQSEQLQKKKLISSG